MGRGRLGCAFWRAHRWLHSIDGLSLIHGVDGWKDGQMVYGGVSVDKLHSSVVT